MTHIMMHDFVSGYPTLGGQMQIRSPEYGRLARQELGRLRDRTIVATGPAGVRSNFVICKPALPSAILQELSSQTQLVFVRSIALLIEAQERKCGGAAFVVTQRKRTTHHITVVSGYCSYLVVHTR